MKYSEYIYDKAFQFEDGTLFRGLKIAYHTSEREYRPGDKVVWVCHALTANSNPEEWWPQLVGPGKLIDTEKYFVVCSNMLGSPYGSSGPANIHEDGKPYFFRFPAVTVRDIVSSMIILRKHLGIEKIDFLLGSSIGGFQAMEWAVMEPEAIANAAFIACSPRATAWVTAYNESQRMALEADPTFRACESLDGGKAGLRCARSIALISYRSYEGYNATQFEQSDDTMFADRAGSYQRYQGKKLADRFDAYSYWYLSRSVDSQNLGRGRGGLEKALARITVKPTVIAIDTDRLFPVEEMAAAASMIPGADFHVISSDFGHDGFLLEYEQITNILKEILCRF